jgi:hypothetical protein
VAGNCNRESGEGGSGGAHALSLVDRGGDCSQRSGRRLELEPAGSEPRGGPRGRAVGPRRSRSSQGSWRRLW